MKIHRLWVNNPLRNYHYMVECEATKEAVVFDPFDVDLIMSVVNQQGLNVTKIINTHEHNDHIAGNYSLKQKTNAKIYAPNFKNYEADVLLNQGDKVSFGDGFHFETYFTPGHTHTHFSYLLHGDTQPHLFSGDTIFNAGAGNVNSGNVDDLYRSFQFILSTFDEQTRIYPGHDLAQSNLAFAMSLEPSNSMIQLKLADMENQMPSDRFVASIADELAYNPFLRLGQSEIIDNLVASGKLMASQRSNQQAVFGAIRSLRNDW